MGIGLGIGINRSNYAQGIFNAYQSRVIADGGVTEAGACVDAVSSLLQSASLLLIPSGYKGGKAYAQIPTNGNGDLTWTRASDAWRTNAEGLIQRVPWNLFTYSEDFSNAAWTKNASSVSTTSVQSPIGPNAFLYSISNLSTNFINQAKAITNTTNTFSIFVKKNVGSLVQLNLGSFNSTFNFDTESISNTSLMSFQRFSNGWYRLILTANPATNTSTFLNIPSSGSVSDSVYIACSQLVEGSSAQTYFPTTDRLNVPRLSYMYGSCPALLLEPQRTNLCLNSNGIGGTSWGSVSGGVGVAPTITLNYATSPDGTNNASRLQLSLGGGTTTTDQSLVTQTLTGIACRGSFYIKTTDGSTKTIYLRGSSATNVVVTGTWTRYDFDAGTLTVTQFGLGLRGGQTPTNSNTADILVWGAQLEVGAYATTLIPTTTASATRVADSFSRNNIYTNGLITSSGGTWFVELRGNLALGRDSSNVSLYLGDNLTPTNGNGFYLVNGGGTDRLTIWKRVSGSGGFLYTTITSTVKMAIKWNGSTADVFVNGTKVVSASSFTTTLMEYLYSASGGPCQTEFIQQMALYPSPLSDTDCTTLTTL
jgi:hypothetical protein